MASPAHHNPQDFARLLQDRLIEAGESRPLEFRSDLFGFVPRGAGVEQLFPLDNYYRYYLAANSEGDRQHIVKQFVRDWQSRWKVGGSPAFVGQPTLPAVAPPYQPARPAKSNGGKIMLMILGLVGLLFGLMCIAPCILGAVVQNAAKRGAVNFPLPPPRRWDFQAPPGVGVTEMLGGQGGGPRFFHNPDRPIIGLAWSRDEWAGESALGSLQPLYDKAEVPERDFNREQAIEWAKDGYVLGGLAVDANQFVNAVRPKWVSQKDGQLDWTNAYDGNWLGDPTGRPARDLGGQGAEVVGIAVRQGLVVDSVGLLLKQPPPQ